MPNNKKHHYVPRFYLKRFSADRKSIGLYNFKRELCVGDAQLKSQCYKNYMYGQEGFLEDMLSRIEDEIAQLFRHIDTVECLPPTNHPDHLSLLYYILIQESRTQYAAEALEQIHDGLFKAVLRDTIAHEHPEIDIDDFVVGLDNPSQYLLGLQLQNYPVLTDLSSILLVNRTGCDFITSDNPVAMCNPLMSFRRSGSNCGLGSKGLLIFLPIAPAKTAMLYDAAVYSISGVKKAMVRIDDESDVHNINVLQMCSADANIYFREDNFGLRALLRKGQGYRREKKGAVTAIRTIDGEEKPGQLIMTSREDIRYKPKLSFLRETKSARKWKEKFRKQRMQPASVVRNRWLMEEHREFAEAVENGTYMAHDFLAFLNDKEKAKN